MNELVKQNETGLSISTETKEAIQLHHRASH